MTKDYSSLIDPNADPSVQFAKLTAAISDDENLPFQQAWAAARQRFPSIYEKLPVVRWSTTQFRDAVRNKMSCGAGCGLSQAWQECQQQYPDLYSAMADKTPMASPPVTSSAVSSVPGAVLGNDGPYTNGPYSPLLMTNVGNVTPAQAMKAFKREVKRLQDEEGHTFDAAWAETKNDYPETLARGNEGKQQEAEDARQRATAIPNAMTGGIVAPRAGKPFNLAALGLPQDATDEEYDRAWFANHQQTVSRDSDAILTSLVALLIQKYGWNADRAKLEAKERYPELWKVAGDKPVAPRTF